MSAPTTPQHPHALAGRVDRIEVLRLAHAYAQSRGAGLPRESVFTARLRTGGVFLDGLRCRHTFVYPGVVRVCVAATGELLAESVPGLPLTPAGADDDMSAQHAEVNAGLATWGQQ